MARYQRSVQLPGISAVTLYEKVSGEIDHFLSKAVPGNFDIERDPQRSEVRVQSSLFSATLSCEEARMGLDVQLSLLASPFKSKLDQAVNRWLAKSFQIATE